MSKGFILQSSWLVVNSSVLTDSWDLTYKSFFFYNFSSDVIVSVSFCCLCFSLFITVNFPRRHSGINKGESPRTCDYFCIIIKKYDSSGMQKKQTVWIGTTRWMYDKTYQSSVSFDVLSIKVSGQYVVDILVTLGGYSLLK